LIRFLVFVLALFSLLLPEGEDGKGQTDHRDDVAE